MNTKQKNYPYVKGDLRVVTVLDGVTATETSDAVNITGAKAVGVVFTEGGIVNNRSGELAITVSPDGTTFYNYNMLLDNVANSNSQTLTRISSKTRDTAGTDILWLSPETLTFRQLKATVTVTDGDTPSGNFTVEVLVVR